MSEGPAAAPAIAFASLTYAEAESASRAGAVLILPCGSTEPHGPHLPLDTDVIIAAGMAERAARRLREEGREAYVLPPIAYAVTDFASGFGGAVSIGAGGAREVIAAALRSLAAQGFPVIALASAHLEPAHLASLREAAAEARESTGAAILFPDITSKRWARMLTEEFRSGACHAGRFETSIVLALRPDAVRRDLARSLPANPQSLSRRIKEGAASFREAGGDRAYFGDPAAATAEEGERTLDTLAGILVTAIREGRSE